MNLAQMLDTARLAAAKVIAPASPLPMPPRAAQPRAEARITQDLSFAQRQIDLNLLCLAFPGNRREALAEWVKPTQDACYRWGIDTIREVASFLANINVESASLTQLTENLNYSADALINMFGRHRISIADANRYGRKPGQKANQEMIANTLYGGDWGRRNLGNIWKTDGWDCRGFGPKQITGRANQEAFAKAMGMTLPEAQAFMRTPLGGMMAAGWFWKSHNLDAKAATPGFRDDRQAINGGVFGLAQVEAIGVKLIEELLRRERAA